MGQTESKSSGGEDRILTIPNAMSLFRILLIPLIVWLYKVRHQYRSTVLVLLVSGATDLLDGWVARRFHMVSNIGKVLDPIADKLTQGALLLSIMTERPRMLVLVLVMIIKETIMIVTGMRVLKKTGKPYSAKWHGKVTTFLLDFTVIIHVLWRAIPVWLSTVLIAVCTGFMIYSLVEYYLQNQKISRSGFIDG
ncbi:MAG: CDP-alcohol phosphatidyltransferase family protein [Lachnospiraceae bacterium]|nr:CDP-alcohol phosphatidyltransferase family protein [Lachnospiraceae bacterium]